MNESPTKLPRLCAPRLKALCWLGRTATSVLARCGAGTITVLTVISLCAKDVYLGAFTRKVHRMCLAMCAVLGSVQGGGGGGCRVGTEPH